MYKLTVRELFAVLEMAMPPQFAEQADLELTNIAYTLEHIKPKGAFFCSHVFTRSREVNELLTEVLKLNPFVVFLTKKQWADLKIKGPFLCLDDVYQGVLKVTKYLRGRYRQRVIGITGSLGKTTTKELIYAALAPSFYEIKSLGNENTLGYMLKNLQRLTPRQEFLVQEFGAYRPGNIREIAGSMMPDAAVLTNINKPHVDIFHTQEAIFKEKLALAQVMMAGSPVFINMDDQFLSRSAEELRRYKRITVGIENAGVDYWGTNIVEYDDYMSFDIVTKGKYYACQLHLHGKHNVYNALLAFAVADYYGVPLPKIQAAIAGYQIVGIHQNLVNIGGYRMFLDAYNSVPDTVISSVGVIEARRLEAGGRRIAVISDIARLGAYGPELHKETGIRLAKTNLDIIYCFGNENAKIMAANIDNPKIEVLYTEDRQVLNAWLATNVTTRDILLFKGPVMRLLNKTVDLVFGSSTHFESDYYDLRVEGDYEFKIVFEEKDYQAKTLFLNKILGKPKRLALPSSYKGLPLFGLAPKLLANCQTLKELQMPDSLINVSEAACQNCSKLKKVEFAASLKVIEAEAFRGCGQLTRLVLPRGLTHIGAKAFADCAKLQEVVLPKSIGYLAEDAFENSPKVNLVWQD